MDHLPFQHDYLLTQQGILHGQLRFALQQVGRCSFDQAFTGVSSFFTMG
jgi:hypothetical protein